MIPPSKVKVGTSVYNLELVEEFPRDTGYQGHYGMTDLVSEQFYISSKQAAGQMQDTVLHEVMHGIVNRAGIRMSDEKEERIIAQLVPWILLVLQENPRLVTYLTEKVK